MKIKTNSIFVLIVFLTMINIPYLSQTTNNILTLVESLILISISLPKIFITFNKKYKSVILFCIIAIISTFCAVKFQTRTMTAVVYALQIVSLYTSIFYICKREGKEFFINSFFRILCVVLIFTDLVVLLTKGNGFGGSTILPYYLVGNKFIVSYLHLLFLSLFYAQSIYPKRVKSKKNIFILLTIFSMIICFVVNCNTGIIGCLTILILNIFNDKKGSKVQFLYNEKVFIVVFVGLTFLLVGSNVILKNDFIVHFVTDVLHRNMDLTGRTKMFNIALKAIALKPYLGYGINSTYIQDVLTWGNAQNGLLKMTLDFGYIGTVSFLLMCYY